MSKKHEKIVAKINARPTRSDVRWSELEALLMHMGATRTEGRGSRVRFKIGMRRLHLHRPHPSPFVNKATLEDVREFIAKL